MLKFLSYLPQIAFMFLVTGCGTFSGSPSPVDQNTVSSTVDAWKNSVENQQSHLPDLASWLAGIIGLLSFLAGVAFMFLERYKEMIICLSISGLVVFGMFLLAYVFTQLTWMIWVTVGACQLCVIQTQVSFAYKFVNQNLKKEMDETDKHLRLSLNNLPEETREKVLQEICSTSSDCIDEWKEWLKQG